MLNEDREHQRHDTTNDGEEDDTQMEPQNLTEVKTDVSPSFRQRLYNRRGILCILLSAFAYALENVLFKTVGDDLHSTEVIFCTYLVKVCLLLPVITYRGYPLQPASKVTYIFLFGRGLISMVAFNAMYFSLRYMNLGDATAIALSSPVFVGIFARIFLKESLGIIDGFLTFVVVAGVFLISKPSFLFGESQEEAISKLIGAAFASFSCICFALAGIFNRKLGLLHINCFVNVFYYVLIGFLGSGVLTSVIGYWSVPPCGYARMILVIMGIVGCFGNCIGAYAYCIEKSLVLGIFITNEIIFAYLLEFLIFNVAPDVIALLGAGLVVSASIMTVIKKEKKFNIRCLGYVLH